MEKPAQEKFESPSIRNMTFGESGPVRAAVAKTLARVRFVGPNLTST